MTKRIAHIDCEDCIACDQCAKVCPENAIVFKNSLHTTVLPHKCTGCGICVDICPAYCISMINLDSPTHKTEQYKRAPEAFKKKYIEDAVARVEERRAS